MPWTSKIPTHCKENFFCIKIEDWIFTGKLSKHIKGGPPIKTCSHTKVPSTPFLSMSLQFICEVCYNRAWCLKCTISHVILMQHLYLATEPPQTLKSCPKVYTCHLLTLSYLCLIKRQSQHIFKSIFHLKDYYKDTANLTALNKKFSLDTRYSEIYEKYNQLIFFILYAGNYCNKTLFFGLSYNNWEFWIWFYSTKTQYVYTKEK